MVGEEDCVLEEGEGVVVWRDELEGGLEDDDGGGLYDDVGGEYEDGGGE